MEENISIDNLQKGVDEASFYYGFGLILKQLGLTDGSIVDLIKTKMLIDAEKDLNKISPECEEEDELI